MTKSVFSGIILKKLDFCNLMSENKAKHNMTQFMNSHPGRGQIDPEISGGFFCDTGSSSVSGAALGVCNIAFDLPYPGNPDDTF